MTKVKLRKPNGDIHVEFERAEDNSYIHAHWIGLQTFDSVKQGANYYAQMIRELPCSCLLNDHKELIGPWDVANDWIVAEWTPLVRSLGLRYLAQVMAPGIYGQMSFNQLHQRIDDKFEIKLFDDVESALYWIQESSLTLK